MEDNYDVDAIEKAYQQIIANKVFKRSSLQERILRYLIDQALAGNDVTEHSIGFELFKDKYIVDQNDSKIRVYVFYLRKKLTEYYNGIGKEESIIFYAEKGQYNLTFKQSSNLAIDLKEEEGCINIKLAKKTTLSILASTILLISVIVFSQFYKPAFIWKPFFKENTLCIVADHYMVADYTNKQKYRYSTFRDINSEIDVSKFKNNNPELKLVAAGFTMMTKMAPFSIHYLDQWFYKYDTYFDVQLESNTKHLDYINKNVIYIGQAKKMQESKSFFLRKSKVFEIIPNGFICKRGGKINYCRGTHNEKKDEEYAIVSYQKMENGMFRMFFVSDHDIGVLSTIKLFTSKDKLKAFVKKLPSSDTNFNALFKVSGLKRTEMSCELVELEVL